MYVILKLILSANLDVIAPRCAGFTAEIPCWLEVLVFLVCFAPLYC